MKEASASVGLLISKALYIYIWRQLDVYCMATSLSWHDEPNPELWLATRAGKDLRFV